MGTDRRIVVTMGDITDMKVDAIVNAANTDAIPAIGTGVGGFPIEECAGVMTETVMDNLKKEDTSIEKIYFVLFDEHAFRVFERALSTKRAV